MDFVAFSRASSPLNGRILVLTLAALAQVSPTAHFRAVIRHTGPADEMRSLIVTVGSVQGFAHEKRCAGELCDGFVVSAHDDSISYVLICASHYYGESDFDKQYNESSRAKNCRAVRPERWAAKTDDRDFLFYSGPNMLFAEYEVSSEEKR